jgi:hypothetical protein
MSHRTNKHLCSECNKKIKGWTMRYLDFPKPVVLFCEECWIKLADQKLMKLHYGRTIYGEMPVLS